MMSQNINILLAYDDKDDCLFFKEALEELELSTQLTAVHDREDLMQLFIKNSNELFHVLFPDLNMLRKTFFTRLEKLKCNEKLKSLPVIIFFTSHDGNIEDILNKNGAQQYICKPTDFLQLKKPVQRTVTLVAKENIPQHPTKNSPLAI